MSESKSEKRKTTIVVDEQYTIELTGRPGDRISQREFDVLQEVKKDPEIAAFGMSDKEIMLFMFPMKFDLTRFEHPQKKISPLKLFLISCLSNIFFFCAKREVLNVWE